MVAWGEGGRSFWISQWGAGCWPRSLTHVGVPCSSRGSRQRRFRRRRSRPSSAWRRPGRPCCRSGSRPVSPGSCGGSWMTPTHGWPQRASQSRATGRHRQSLGMCFTSRWLACVTHTGTRTHFTESGSSVLVT